MQIMLISVFDLAKAFTRIQRSSNFEFKESMFRLRIALMFSAVVVVVLVVQLVVAAGLPGVSLPAGPGPGVELARSAALEVSFLLDLVIMIMFLVTDMSCTRCGYSGCARRGNTYSDKVTVRLERHLELVGQTIH